MAKQSSQIAVPLFHQFLIWPLLLRNVPLGNSGERPVLQRLVEEFEKDTAWREVKSAQTIPPTGEPPYYAVPQEFPYEEIVYFHSFVRDFLFGDGKEPYEERPLRLLERHDVKAVQVTLGQPQPQATNVVTLKVDRVHLYLANPCVAVLVVEVSNGTHTGPLSLETVLNFQEQVRRVYPAFWWDSDKGDNACEPGQCPLRLFWLDANDKPLNQCDLQESKPLFERFAREGGEPPVFSHWKYFFGAIPPIRGRHHYQPDENADDGPIAYQQIMDERMLVMSFIGVDEPNDISEGDFDRITFCDQASSDPFPFEEKFLAAARGKHTYDRWRHQGTRYVVSGYGFAVVGKAGGTPATPFETHVRRAFRTIHLRTGILVHYEKAALLYFADALAESIKTIDNRSPELILRDEKFRSKISNLQVQFLTFRSRSLRFREVTNQEQGRQLCTIWFEHLGEQALFQELDEVSQRLQQVLADYESRSIGASAGLLSGFGLRVAILLGFLQIILAGIQSEILLPPHSGIITWQSFLGWAVLLTPAFIIAALVFSTIHFRYLGDSKAERTDPKRSKPT